MNGKGLNLIKISLLIFGLGIGLAESACGQGMYFERGQSSDGFGVDISCGKHIAGLSFSMGASYAATVDVNISIGFIRNLDFRNNSAIFGVGAVLHPIKQNQRMPLAIDLAASFTTGSRGGGDSDPNGAVYAASIYRSFLLKNDSKVIPEFGAAFAANQDKSAGFDNKDAGSVTYIFNLHLVPHLNSRRLVVLTPYAAYGNSQIVIGLAAGFFSVPPRTY